MGKNLKIIYQNENLLVVDKPPTLVVFAERETKEKILKDLLLKEFPFLKNVGKQKRHGIVHRLDKETSGIVLVAKNEETFDFLQKEFKEKRVVKKYLALVVGKIREKKGTIETLIGRDPKDRKRQRAFLLFGPEAKKKGKRKAETSYRALKLLSDGKKIFSLLEVMPKTGRKHQIRTHLAFLGHPIVGDKLYGFKNQPCPKELKRQFLHASCLKIRLPDGKEKEFKSKTPRDLKNVLKNLKEISYDEKA